MFNNTGAEAMEERILQIIRNKLLEIGENMVKNSFRFARCTLSKEGVDGRTENSRYIELIPKDYPTEKFSENEKAGFVYNDIEFWQM